MGSEDKCKRVKGIEKAYHSYPPDSHTHLSAFVVAVCISFLQQHDVSKNE